MAIQKKWSSRELERQFKAALFERSVLNRAKVTPVVTQAVRLNPLSDSFGRVGVDLCGDLDNTMSTTQPLAGRLSSASASGEETGPQSRFFRF